VKTPKPGRYLLTGATGFVGAYLARRLLESGQEVHLLARESSNLWRLADLQDRLILHHVDLLEAERLAETLQAIRPTHIWHLATYGGFATQQEALRIAQTNFMGTVNLLHASLETGFETFINTGSSSEYGIKTAPMREADLPEPLSAYGASKAGATLYAQGLAKTNGLPIFNLRLFSPFGPQEDPSRLVATVIKACVRGEAPRLASPHSVRDFIYVEDVFRFYQALDPAALAPGEILNVGSGKQSTVGDLVATALKLSGSDLEPIWGSAAPRPNEPTSWVADMTKAERLLNWKPAFSLEAGLAETLDWARRSLPVAP
jgi:nucleoside-diphosphate-sugar epimerase